MSQSPAIVRNVTIGNAEIVNMLVVDQVAKTEARIAQLKAEAKDLNDKILLADKTAGDKLMEQIKAQYGPAIMSIIENLKTLGIIQSESENSMYVLENLKFGDRYKSVFLDALRYTRRDSAKPKTELPGRLSTRFAFSGETERGCWSAAIPGMRHEEAYVTFEVPIWIHHQYKAALAMEHQYIALQVEIDELEEQLENKDKTKERILAEVTRMAISNSPEIMSEVQIMVDRLQQPLQLVDTQA